MCDRGFINDAKNLLQSQMSNTSSRRALVESALFGCDVLADIDWTGPAADFTHHLVTTLCDYGDCEPGKPAMVALLEEARDKRGSNYHSRYNDLIARAKQATNMVQTGNEATMNATAGFMFLLEIGKWAADELSQRWKYKREQQAEADEIAEQTADSPTLQAIWTDMTQKRSEQEVNRILKIIDDNRQLIIGYEQDKVNARKQARFDGNQMLLQGRLQHLDEEIDTVKAEMKKNAKKIGIEIVE